MIAGVMTESRDVGPRWARDRRAIGWARLPGVRARNADFSFEKHTLNSEER